MVREENDCCGCAVPAYPCLGDACDLRHARHYYCDECKEEVDQGDLYYFEGRKLCIDCIKKELEEVE